MLLLDTANLDGYHHGSIGRRQMHWLEERLIELHSTYRSADGEVVTTTNADRVVVLASHHGLATLTNARQDPGGFEQDHPRATAEEARALFHRFGNVVLWLNGDRHLNEVVHWPSPYDPTTGIWDVSMASMADWPCQARVVELVAASNGSLSLDDARPWGRFRTRKRGRQNPARRVAPRARREHSGSRTRSEMGGRTWGPQRRTRHADAVPTLSIPALEATATSRRSRRERSPGFGPVSLVEREDVDLSNLLRSRIGARRARDM
ncbi:MAG: hypothetical protein WCF24_04635 [Acidimicrobiales bacterium]